MRKARVARRVEGKQLGAGRFESLEVVGIGEAERPPLGDGDTDIRLVLRVCEWLRVERRCPVGDGDDGVEIAGGGDGCRQPFE